MTENRNWKLIHDPLLKKGLQKLVRFDGNVPGNSVYNVHHLSDPRTLAPSRHPWGAARESLDLPIPCFKIDENYVGLPPPKEVSFFDLNDNISPSFLGDLCKKCGEYEELQIYYHPVDKRHLGIGRVVFKKIKDAKICIEKYDGTSIMGKTVNVFIDAFGKQIKARFGELSSSEVPSSSAKEWTVAKRTQTSNVPTTSVATSAVSTESSSTTTPHSVPSVVPEDPMISQQQTFGYPPQVYPHCMPSSSVPYPWSGPPTNYWPQSGVPWPSTWPPTVSVPFPTNYPVPYPHPTQQSSAESTWPSSTGNQTKEKPVSDEVDKNNRKTDDQATNRDKRSSHRRQKHRERTPERSSSLRRDDSTNKKRFENAREPVDKRSNRSAPKSEERKRASPPDGDGLRSRNRREERSSSSRRRRDDSDERHRRCSRTPPKKLGNKLYHWHNRMHTSPIVAKYQSYRYDGRSSKEQSSKDSHHNHSHSEKRHSSKERSKNVDDDEFFKRKHDEPVVETYEEEYYRRKKLGHPVVDAPSHASSKRVDESGEKAESGASRSTTKFVDEIEEYKIVTTRKLCQRVAPVVPSSTGDKLEVITSTEEDDDANVDDNGRKTFSSHKRRKKTKKQRSSSVSSAASSVRLQYSSLSEGESSTNEKERRSRSTGLNVSSSNVDDHLECVSSSENDDRHSYVSRDESPSSSSSSSRGHRRKNDERRHRHQRRERRDEEPKHIVREVFKSKRIDRNESNSRNRRYSSQDRRRELKNAVDERLSGGKNVIKNEFTELRRSCISSLDKRIQNILHAEGKSSTDGAGTPLQDERIVDESLKSLKIFDKKEIKIDDDDKMSLSSGSRPTSRNEMLVDSLQKSSVLAPIPTLPMTGYAPYPPSYHPSYDPNVYAAYAAAYAPSPYGLPPPPSAQFAQQMPPWQQNYPPPYAPTTPFDIVRPTCTPVNCNNPQVMKQLTNKSCGEVMKNLKSVLHKDVLKRMIENTAFQSLDAWFATQEKLNDILKPKSDTIEKPTSTPVVQAPASTAVTTTLSRLFGNENNSTGLNNSSSGNDLTRLFGFGLRASLPKLPSFKRKILKSPPPSVRSCSDDEKPQRRRKLSSSSSESLHSEKASDESDDEEKLSGRSVECSSDDDDEDKAKTLTEIATKDCFVALETVSDDEDDGEGHVSDHVSTDDDEEESEEAEKSSASDENDKAKISAESSNEDSDDESCVEVSDEEASDDDNEKSIENTKTESKKPDVSTKDSALQQQEQLYKRSAPQEPSLGIYSEIVKEQDTVSRVDGSMWVAANETYVPTLYDHCYFPSKPAVEFFLPETTKSALISKENEMATSTTVVSPPKKSSRGRPAKKQLQQFTVDDEAFGKSKSEMAFFSSSVDSRIKTSLSDTFYRKKPAAPPLPDVVFKPRDAVAELKVLYDFVTNGVDEEDVNLLKRAYDTVPDKSWLRNTHWMPHPTTTSPPTKRRRISTDEIYVHKTGSARTEGFYRPSGKLKNRFTHAARRANDDAVLPQSLQLTEQAAKQQLQLSREARSNQRRLLTTLGDADFLKFNQLKYRKKLIRFARSKIHGWGLFALEDIGPDEMIIEYVGEKVRLNVAEKRERNYEKVGIGSSYLFRIDNDMAIDATKRGAVARFINHSCNPSCYAKIISLDGEKRIVIYSKQNIAKGEEITYDYKFPFEDVKIPCNCGAHNCRGSLN